MTLLMIQASKVDDNLSFVVVAHEGDCPATLLLGMTCELHGGKMAGDRLLWRVACQKTKKSDEGFMKYDSFISSLKPVVEVALVSRPIQMPPVVPYEITTWLPPGKQISRPSVQRIHRHTRTPDGMVEPFVQARCSNGEPHSEPTRSVYEAGLSIIHLIEITGNGLAPWINWMKRPASVVLVRPSNPHEMHGTVNLLIDARIFYAREPANVVHEPLQHEATNAKLALWG